MTAIKSVLLLMATIILLWIGAALSLQPVTPQVWSAPPNPGLEGRYAQNSRLAELTRLTPIGYGPEDIACGTNGSVMSGLLDGRIVRWGPDGTYEILGNTHGRPLGVITDREGDLLIADARRGLLKLDKDGVITVLADHFDGRRLRFVDDLAIGADGRIWFTDASQRFGFENTMLDFWEGSRTGRLLSYDPATLDVKLHIEGLFFANGVTMGPDDAYVLVNETGLGRVRRLWLSGPRAGSVDTFIEHLPGTPDNINFDGDGIFWIAMPSLRASLDALSDKPLLRQILALAPDAILALAAEPVSFVIGVDVDGRLVHNLQDSNQGYPFITSATPCEGRLYLGSLQAETAAYLPLPD